MCMVCRLLFVFLNHSVFSGDCVTRSLLLCVWFVDKQQSLNLVLCLTHKTKDRVTQTPLKTEKVQKDKQRSTNHTHKTKDRVTQTPLKTEKVQKDKQRS